jgi:hypothetical protein
MVIFHKLNYNTWLYRGYYTLNFVHLKLTKIEKSQLTAGYGSICCPPLIATDSAPHTTIAEFQTTFIGVSTSYHPEVSIMAHCS